VMALLFSLSAECGAKQESAELVASHFEGCSVIVADGAAFPCNPYVWTVENAWWASVFLDGVTKSGIRDERDARELTEIGFQLYDRLRSAPSFRYALVGVEVDEFRYFEELDDDVVNLDFNGLVL